MYLDPDFDIKMLSDNTQIPSHHLSYYFNHIIHQKFVDWRNQQRIIYSKELIASGVLEIETLSSIAQKSGFKSQSSFISSFKKFTGFLPSEFPVSVLEQTV